jgi:hypothetical protein
LLFLATTLLVTSIGFPARAAAEPIVPLTVATGWTDFFFGGPDASWDRRFALSTSVRVRLTVTDFALSGDQFLVSFTGAGTGSFSTLDADQRRRLHRRS